MNRSLSSSRFEKVPFERPARPPARRCAAAFTAAGLALAVLLLATPAAPAQSPIRSWAEWVVARSQWKGPTVAYPELRERPRPAPLRLDSDLQPLSVQAAAGIRPETAQAALDALEQARELLLETGWAEPFPDGGRGRTAGFDLYLDPQSERPAAAFADVPVSWSELDGVSSFAVMNPHLVHPGQLEACVVDAYAQAVALGQDPAEAASWRRATGAYTAWLVTGLFGCSDAVAEQQQQSWRGWITGAPDSGSGGALFLAILSEREDGNTGTFVRELWQFARQSSRNVPGPDLRASPDLWEALTRALENAGESLDEIVLEMAVARYFAGAEPRRRAGIYLAPRTLRSNAEVPVPLTLSLDRLPARLPVSDPPLQPHGSAYYLVDTSTAAAPLTLKVWLSGEIGARWSLAAVRLSHQEREQGRTAVTVPNGASGFLAAELGPGIDRVLLVVTHLPVEKIDADGDTYSARAFQLIVDREQYASEN